MFVWAINTVSGLFFEVPKVVLVHLSLLSLVTTPCLCSPLPCCYSFVHPLFLPWSWPCLHYSGCVPSAVCVPCLSRSPFSSFSSSCALFRVSSGPSFFLVVCICSLAIALSFLLPSSGAFFTILDFVSFICLVVCSSYPEWKTLATPGCSLTCSAYCVVLASYSPWCLLSMCSTAYEVLWKKLI